jgi:hypothetical protein
VANESVPSSVDGQRLQPLRAQHPTGRSESLPQRMAGEH